jgi:hypothetical protein
MRPKILTSVIALTVVPLTSCSGVSGEGENLVELQAELATLERVAMLPNQSLTSFQHAVLPGTITNDRGIRAGSIGSDIFRAHGDQGNTFWMMTDRGPNGQPGGRRTFAVPEFNPQIVEVKIKGSTIELMQQIAVVGTSGAPVGGLPNVGTDEVAWNFNATVQLGVNPSGIDPEGLVRMPAGDFWIIEEYRPSFLHVSANGEVLNRVNPKGLALGGTDYPVSFELPAILNKRRANRGFEGLALSPEGSTLTAAVQSPLEHPTRNIGRASRNLRFVSLDIAIEKPVAEYAYQMDEVCAFLSRPVGCGVAPGDMKVSGLAPLADQKMLVLERTDDVAKIYMVDLAAATNILDSKWDDVATSPALEEITDFVAAGLAPLEKTLVVDLSTLPNVPKKIEGVTVINPETLAVSADNDFGLVDETVYDAAGNLANDTGVKSQVLYVRLDTELPH